MVSPLVAMFCLHLRRDNIFSWQTNFVCNTKYSFRGKSILSWSERLSKLEIRNVKV